MISLALDPVSYALWGVIIGITFKQEHRITKLEMALAENLKLWNSDILKRTI